jgi:hypothetical protein
LALTITSSSEAGRGNGRSYWPREREASWPTMAPDCMPNSIGPIIEKMPLSMSAVGSPVPPASARSVRPSRPAGGAASACDSRSRNGR